MSAGWVIFCVALGSAAISAAVVLGVFWLIARADRQSEKDWWEDGE